MDKACELRGSKHGHPFGRYPKPFGSGGAAVAAAVGGGHSVRLDEHAGFSAVAVVCTVGNVGNCVKTVGGCTVVVVAVVTPVPVRGVENISWPMEVIAVPVAVVGLKVAPGGRVIYGNGVLRAIGGHGVGFFQSVQQKKAPLWRVAFASRRNAINRI